MSAIGSDEFFPTEAEIDVMEELMEAAIVLEEHDIPYDGIGTLDGMKERLQLEGRRRRGEKPKELISKGMLESAAENKKKRQRLIQVFQELLGILEVTSGEDSEIKSSMVDDFLSAEGTTTNIQKDCQGKISELKKGDCVILIAGETSAGKSSLLNLLLDTPGLLPTAVIPCTSSITSVRYGETRCARVIYNDPGKPDTVIEPLDEAGIKRLHSVAFMQGNERETGHDVTEVQVFLPIWFLKTGLVLADTPGIGENDFLEDYLHQYVANNEILGFIYIIMSDAAGGVKEDRLLTLLRLIMEEQKKNKKGLPFDPRASMFVCNRFDNIPPEDQDKVKDHILEQLGKNWPEFKSNMAVFFSTRNAQRDIEAHEDYINVQYKTLLEGLSSLYTISADRRVKASYKWLERVIWRITHITRTIYRRLDMSQRDKEEQTRTIQGKLRKLNQNTNAIIHELRVDMDKEVEHFSKELRKYLDTTQAKFQLCSVWQSDEIPQLSEKAKSQDHWNWIKERVDGAFYTRLCALLEEWDAESGKVEDIEEKMINEVQSKLGILENEISEIESGMTSAHIAQSTKEYGGRRMSLRGSRIIGPRSALTSEMVTMKLSLGARAATGNPLLKVFRNPRSKNFFKKNPEAWAKERAEKLLKNLINEKKTKTADGRGVLETLITHLMQQPIEYINRIEEIIPSLIEANASLLTSLQDLNIQTRNGMSKYGTVMQDIESLRKLLMDYGEGYIFVNDFKINEIKILHDVRDGASLSTTLSPKVIDMIKQSSANGNSMVTSTVGGLWTVLAPGVLLKDNQDTNITIKIYLPSSGVQSTYREIAMLRCLVHTDLPIAEFLGTHHANTTLPAFVFNEELLSLQSYMKHISTTENNDLHRIISEVAQGVAYIHCKSLVHMEMTTTTVTVNRNGEVRLTGACYPRKANLPIDRECIVSNFVYLSPEVLKGDLYITSSDMYGFGLMLFELIGNQQVFKTQRNFSFQNFTQKVNPVTMLPLDVTTKQWLPDSMYKIVARCVDLDLTLRPKMMDVVDMLKDCKSEPLLSPVLRTTTPAELFRRSGKTP